MDEESEAAVATARADADAVLFCPFCEESFEGETRCPEHDLALVTLLRLQRQRGPAIPADDEDVALHDGRFGRGLLLVAAATVLVAFFLPVLRVVYPDGESSASGFAAASSVAANLWVVPAVAVAFLSILLRRRTPAKLRGSRLAVAALAGLGLTSLGFTLARVYAGVSRNEALFGVQAEVHVLWGAWLLCGALLLALVAGLRLGVPPRTRPPSYDVG